MATIALPFAASGGRRVPNAGELANGIPCGPLDDEMFNWLFWWTSGQLDGYIESSGESSDDTSLTQMAKLAIRQSISYRVAGGTPNALTATFSPAIANHGGTTGMPVRLKIIAMNTGPATFDAGPGPLPIQTMRGNPLALGDLPLGSIVTLVGTGTAWLLSGVAYSDFRPILTANLNLYVATTGSDTLNTGLTIASPFATLQRAWNYMQARLDLNGFNVVVNVAAGTYTGGLVAAGNILDSTGRAMCNSWVIRQPPRMLTSQSPTERRSCRQPGPLSLLMVSHSQAQALG